jgi:dihydroflavonol-4-reductase
MSLMVDQPVFLTGGAGFLGFALARKLVSAGRCVKALVRPTSPWRDLADLGVEIHFGDMRDRRAVRAALFGCQHMFHVAADYRLWARNPREIYHANVEGCRVVMEEALAAGVERVVYTSSVATLALSPNGAAADESSALSEQEGVGAYKCSKIAAERLVLNLIEAQKLPAVIVNPSTPIGPRDIRPTPTGRMVAAAAAGRMPVYVDTGLNIVHVDDVAEGHLSALKHGTVGERYILGGDNVTCAQMLDDVAAIVGRRGPLGRLPLAAAFPIAYGSQAVAWLTGQEPLATVDGVRLARHQMFFTAAKAQRQLGYRARPYTEALQDAIRWFHDAGYVKRPAGHSLFSRHGVPGRA